MIRWIADNIISPLGYSSQQNYEAVREGRCALRQYHDKCEIPQPFTAALFTDEQNDELRVEGMTRFESLALLSAKRAIEKTNIDVTDDSTVFILSTTKANIDTLSPSIAAKKIAQRIGIITEPVVVCNACISGVAAIVLALRLLDAGIYKHAIVCGADIQDKFTISGFQALNALSADEAKPFDMERNGLNLGEAAATIVFSASIPVNEDCWVVSDGAIYNDAFHIVSPSKDAEGAMNALKAVTVNVPAEEIAFINAHGTATMFNDQMESVAIEKAGLNEIPVNGLKGVFGHTLGAAGVVETIVSLYALNDGLILKTKGYKDRGVSGKINVTTDNSPTNKKCFIKMISGFGGCNGAICVRKTNVPVPGIISPPPSGEGSGEGLVPVNVPVKTVHITPQEVTIDGRPLSCTQKGDSLLVELYRNHIADYPKFYKMDGLSRLGFVASELLTPPKDPTTSIILFNNSSSAQADRDYMTTIADGDNYFPSPAKFIYTLPNIVTGEIAIRNGYKSETSFYIINQRDDSLIDTIAKATLSANGSDNAIIGWIDYQDSHHFEAFFYTVDRQQN